MKQGQNKIKALLFDAGGVLVDFDLEATLDQLFKYSKLSPAQCKQLLDEAMLIRKFGKGEMTPSQFYQKLITLLLIEKLSYEEFVSVWNSTFSKKADMWGFVERLRKTIDLYLFSDTNIVHFEYPKRNYAIDKLFKDVFLSYVIGTRKGERKCYRYVIERLRLKPGEIGYVDDNLKYVDRARSFGIVGFEYYNADKLEKDLSCFVTIDGSD